MIGTDGEKVPGKSVQAVRLEDDIVIRFSLF